MGWPAIGYDDRNNGPVWVRYGYDLHACRVVPLDKELGGWELNPLPLYAADQGALLGTSLGLHLSAAAKCEILPRHPCENKRIQA